MVSDENPQHDSDLLGCLVGADLIDRRLNLTLNYPVGEQDDGRASIRGDALLGDAVEADLVVAEGGSKAPDHTRDVARLKADVVGVAGLTDGNNRPWLRVDAGQKVTAEARNIDRSGQIEQVSDDGARSWQASGAGAEEHNLTNGASGDKDRVIDPINTGQWVAQWQQHRVNADVKTTSVDWLSQSDHLDPVAELGCQPNIEVGNPGDTLSVDPTDFDRRIEGERGKD